MFVPVTPTPHRTTVLVADDEPLTRWALLRTLQNADLDVTLASSKAAVCDLLRVQAFRVVILANELAHDSMTDVLESLVGDDVAQGVVILYDGDNADEFGHAFPGAALVQKPFSLDAVMSAISGFLEPTREAC